MKQPEHVQQPQNDRNDHNAVQNGFDRSLHWDEAIHQPQQDSYHNQNFQ
jgi:hypothetical protein